MRAEDGVGRSHLPSGVGSCFCCCVALFEADMSQGSSWRHVCSSSSSAIGSVCWMTASRAMHEPISRLSGDGRETR